MYRVMIISTMKPVSNVRSTVLCAMSQEAISFETIRILLGPYGKPISSFSVSVLVKKFANLFRKVIIMELVVLFCE